MDRLRAMRVFVGVADGGGFAPAARKLGLTPSAVTRLVAGLEEHLGLRLLNRTTRAVSLTDAGQRYLVRARQLLLDLDEAEALAREERAHPAGRLTVAASNVFGRLHVSPLMCDYLSRHPGVSGELLLSDRNVALVEEGIDLAVRIGDLADQSVIARRLGAVRRILVATPAYLAGRGVPTHPADLSAHALIHFAIAPGVAEWRFQAEGQDIRLPIHPHYTTNSADAAIWHCARNGGIVRLLSYQVIDAVRAGDLVPLLTAFEPPPLPIHIVHPGGRLVPAKVRAFIDQAVAETAWDFTAF
ncbi:LysR family transcriptional regulator [Elstera cyanobacteriorum]|uniref:LysR family transcriptional regulator n=1 Tax=Elstera cyanobacteriorum TaxID=2022747 RepID=UPI00235600EC|nr:LysR family transcriptional regulator [Elstera cyanobacteriorum]MCK6443017.1 LysR family transcriptional regulator [Elstera cyanobacteriorum]